MAPRLKALLLAALLATVPSLAGAAEDPRVDRLTDLVVRAIPLGEVFDALARDMPAWPMQDKPDAVGPGKLACLRAELSSAGYRRAVRKTVVDYTAEHAARVDGDIALLDGGAAMIMNKLMIAGAEQERTGVPTDENALLADSTPEQLQAFMDFMTGADYVPLRRLAGVGEAFDAQASAEENEAGGEAAGADLATRAMLRAMGDCDVPSSVFFD